jgi:small conductance mechanosensitive channel
MNPEVDASQLLISVDQIHFVTIAMILVVAWLSTNLVERFLPHLAERLPGRMRLHILPSVPVLRLLILVLAITLVVFQIVNPTVEALVAMLGAAVLAIGFDFKDYISSLVAGIVAIYERPYRPGDWVGIDGVYGEVKSIGMRALRMVTPDDTVVTIPHLAIWTTSIHNANDGQRDLQCVADFYLHPDHDAVLVRQKLREVALTSPFIQLERPVSVVVAEKPWATHYRLKAYPIEGRDQFQFTSDLTVRGKQALAELEVKAAAWLPIPGNVPGG